MYTVLLDGKKVFANSNMTAAIKVALKLTKAGIVANIIDAEGLPILYDDVWANGIEGQVLVRRLIKHWDKEAKVAMKRARYFRTVAKRGAR